MSSPDFIPTEGQRLEFARALVTSGRLHDGRAPALVCTGCRRPWPLDALTYGSAVDAVAFAHPPAPYLFVRHACGSLRAIPRAVIEGCS